MNPSNQEYTIPKTELVLAQLASSVSAAAESLARAGSAQSTAQKPAAPRRGLSRSEAAAFIGVSPTTFDGLVKSKVMPKPIRIKSRTVWDVRALDAAFDALASTEEVNPWDEWA